MIGYWQRIVSIRECAIAPVSTLSNSGGGGGGAYAGGNSGANTEVHLSAYGDVHGSVYAGSQTDAYASGLASGYAETHSSLSYGRNGGGKAGAESAGENPAGFDIPDKCSICLDKIGGPANTLLAFGRCNHKICSLCALKIRALSNETSWGQRWACAECRDTLEVVVTCLSADSSAVFQDFSISYPKAGKEGAPKLQGYSYHSKSRMFFPWTYFRDRVAPLFRYTCKVVGCSNKSFADDALLEEHYQKTHGKVLCVVCLRNESVSHFNRIHM